MSQAWTVKVWVGAYSWTNRSTDTIASLGFGVGVPVLTTPLQVASSLPNSDLTPLVQPNSDTATVSVLAAQVADLNQLSIGDTVTVRYWPSAAPAVGDHPIVEFAGRVSTLTAKPHDLGVLYTVGCTDYLADLGEPQVGGSNYPAQTLDARVRQILTEAGCTVPAGVNLYDEIFLTPAAVTIGARAAAPTSALELLTHTLAQMRLDYGAPPLFVAMLRQATTPGGRRLAIGPGTYPATFADGPAVLNAGGQFLIGAAAQRSPAFTAPLRVSLVGGVYKLTGSSANTSVGGVTVLNGALVSRVVGFSQRKGDAINTTTVTSPLFGGSGQVSVGWGGFVPIRAVVETELPSIGDGSDLAILYQSPLPPTGKALWTADTLEWEIGAEPGAWSMPAIGRGLMVSPILLKWSPIEREWYVGMTVGWTFTLDGSKASDVRPKATVDVLPWNVDTSTATNPIRWSDLVAAQTYANTSSRDLFTDYALAGF